MLRGMCAALVAMHSVGLCCDGTLTALHVAIAAGTRELTLCSVGSWPGASDTVLPVDEWAAAACEPFSYPTTPQQPAAAPNASVRQPKREAPKFCDVGSGVENAMPAAKAAKRNEPEVIDLT